MCWQSRNIIPGVNSTGSYWKSMPLQGAGGWAGAWHLGLLQAFQQYLAGPRATVTWLITSVPYGNEKRRKLSLLSIWAHAYLSAVCGYSVLYAIALSVKQHLDFFWWLVQTQLQVISLYPTQEDDWGVKGFCLIPLNQCFRHCQNLVLKICWPHSELMCTCSTWCALAQKRPRETLKEWLIQELCLKGQRR